MNRPIVRVTLCAMFAAWSSCHLAAQVNQDRTSRVGTKKWTALKVMGGAATPTHTNARDVSRHIRFKTCEFKGDRVALTQSYNVSPKKSAYPIIGASIAWVEFGGTKQSQIELRLITCANEPVRIEGAYLPGGRRLQIEPGEQVLQSGKHVGLTTIHLKQDDVERMAEQPTPMLLDGPSAHRITISPILFQGLLRFARHKLGTLKEAAQWRYRAPSSLSQARQWMLPDSHDGKPIIRTPIMRPGSLRGLAYRLAATPGEHKVRMIVMAPLKQGGGATSISGLIFGGRVLALERHIVGKASNILFDLTNAEVAGFAGSKKSAVSLRLGARTLHITVNPHIAAAFLGTLSQSTGGAASKPTSKPVR